MELSLHQDSSEGLFAVRSYDRERRRPTRKHHNINSTTRMLIIDSGWKAANREMSWQTEREHQRISNEKYQVDTAEGQRNEDGCIIWTGIPSMAVGAIKRKRKLEVSTIVMKNGKIIDE